MTTAEILANFRRDADFVALPQEWQTQIAEKVAAGATPLEGLASVREFGKAKEAVPLTIQNIPQLAPQLMNEWNRVRALGDRRTWEQWANDHLRVDPNWVENAQGYAPQAEEGLSGTPEQNAALERWREKASLAHTTISTNGTSSTIPLEQDLLSRAVNRGYSDMEGDEARQKWARDLVAQYDQMYGNVDRTLAGIYDGSQLKVETDASDRARRTIIESATQTEAEKAAALDRLMNTANGGLKTQLDARGQAITNLSEAQQEALRAQLAARQASLEKDAAARRESLAAQLGARGANIATDLSERNSALSAEVASRRAALEDAVKKLYAAQEPLNAERIKSAQTQATAVNLAAQQARDQAVAQAAQDGYVGSSTGTDSAMARALLAGRQGAAEKLGEAKVSNAQDMTGIGRYNATEGRSLADYGATETRKLSDYGSGERRSLADFGADENRGLADFVSGETRTLSDYGANETRTLANQLATNRRDLADYGANETRNIVNQGAAYTYNNTSDRANQVLAANTDAAQREYTLFSNDVNRRLSNLSLPTRIVNDRLSLANAAEEFGNSGLTRTLNSLNFFRTNGSNAPTTTPVNTPANTATGSGMMNLGAGLAGGGFSIINSTLTNGRRNTGSTRTGTIDDGPLD